MASQWRCCLRGAVLATRANPSGAPMTILLRKPVQGPGDRIGVVDLLALVPQRSSLSRSIGTTQGSTG